MKDLFPPLKNINLPNLITSLSILTGFICITLLINNHINPALTLFAAAIVFDRIDGTIARKLKLTSDFGKELDSLADSFSFCILPAVFAYFMGFTNIYAMLVSSIYILSGVWRLAHFNITGIDNSNGKDYFYGIPTTVMGSWFLIIISVFHIKLNINIYYILTPFFVLSSLLMLSSIKYSKNGYFTKALYFLLPTAVILLLV